MGHGAWGASALSRAMPDLFALAFAERVADKPLVRAASPTGEEKRLRQEKRSTGIMERILLERASKIEHL
jgi:hypothetical protein